MKKFYLLLLLLSAGCTNMWSQSFNWAKDEGLYAYDYGMGIGTDNSGNVYVTGKFEQNGAIFSGVSVPCAGNHDIYLAKYSAGGSLIWIRTGGGTVGDYSYGLACDGTNNVYIAGEIEGWGNLISFPGSTITLNSIGDNDVLVAKYDLAGNLQWAKNEGWLYNEKAQGVTYDAAGNVYVCGHYSDTSKFGGNVLYSNGGRDIFVFKYDANGNFQWVRNAGGPGRDEAKSIKCDAAGNVYVCGMYSNGAVFGSTTYSTVSGSYFDSYIAKYSSSGTLLWVKTAGGSFDEVAWSLAIDNAGLLYIAGEFNASAFFGPTQLITTGNADVFIACYDANGNEQWAKGAGGPLIDRARGIGCDGNNLFITGQFGNTATFGTSTLTASDSSDVFFASLDNSGTFLNALSVGGAADAFEPLGYESGNAICADPSGEVYATGGLLDGGTFGSTTVSHYSRTDVFVTKISQLLNVSTLANIKENINIYPNPATGNFTIELEQFANEKIEVIVYNNLGQIITKNKKQLPSSKLNLDLSQAENGLYSIQIRNEGQILTTKKVVIQK